MALLIINFIYKQNMNTFHYLIMIFSNDMHIQNSRIILATWININNRTQILILNALNQIRMAGA
jgi:hypothetical protein